MSATSGTSSDDKERIKSDSPMSFQVWHYICRVVGLRMLFPRPLRLPQKIGDEFVALVHQLAARAAVVFRTDHVLAEERERDGRIAVGDDRVRKHTRIHLAPAHGLGGRG